MPDVFGPRKYRKRPMVIDAIQWTGDNDEDVEAFVGVTDVQFNRSTRQGDKPTGDVYDFLHRTWVNFGVGDWIIRGLKGEFYPCANEIFVQSYEAVEE